MPLWFRTPKGVVVRSTPDWYAHQRARVSGMVAATLTPAEYPAVALANIPSPGSMVPPGGYNLHVIGIWVNFTAPASVYGRYVAAPIPPSASMVQYAGMPVSAVLE